MHCDMCGNCKIFRHFLLFPLLLSDPPVIYEKQRKKEEIFNEGVCLFVCVSDDDGNAIRHIDTWINGIGKRL